MKLTVTCCDFSCGSGVRFGEHRLDMNDVYIEPPDENTQREILSQMDIAVVAEWMESLGCLVGMPTEKEDAA